MDTQFVVYVYDGIPVDRKKKKKNYWHTLPPGWISKREQIIWFYLYMKLKLMKTNV